MSSFVRTCLAPFLTASVTGRAPDRPPRILGTLLARASRGGANSVSVTATEQLTLRTHPRALAALRHAELLAVCAAMARR
jgi:hypothetical protein